RHGSAPPAAPPPALSPRGARPERAKRASNARGAASVSARRRGSGGIGGAEPAKRASTARAPGTLWCCPGRGTGLREVGLTLVEAAANDDQLPLDIDPLVLELEELRVHRHDLFPKGG